ncbi:hypothetical protein [Quadrisphaera sp. INWT6]|nr:hypothetical protein [Quadrisphaera sp. INWT6]
MDPAVRGTGHPSVHVTREASTNAVPAKLSVAETDHAPTAL